MLGFLKLLHFGVEKLFKKLGQAGTNWISFCWPFVSLLLFSCSLIYRILKDCGQTTINLPIFGEVLMLSLGVLPFCATFAILWAVFRHASCAWIGQDILVRHIFQLMFPFLLLFCVFLFYMQFFPLKYSACNRCSCSCFYFLSLTILS